VKPFLVFWSIVLLATGGVLAAVAALQYRWNNEASEAEGHRIHAELESLAMKWHTDLYVEFSAICVAMQVGPDSGARDTWNDYLERYVEWNYALPRQSIPYVYRNPDLVGEVYIWETGRSAKPRLFLLNLDTRRIEASSVPPELVNLLPRLKASSATLPMALDAWNLHNPGTDEGNQTDPSPNSNPAGSNPIAGWQFDERAPAIVRPIFHHDPGKPLSIQQPVDWIVITMDMNVLEKRVLPELSGRYFAGPGDLDYKVRVIATGSTPRTIYASDPAEQDLGPADATIKIFDPLPVSGEDLFRQNAPNSNMLRDSRWHSSFGLIWFPIIEYGDQSDSWVLELRHRSGSLQAVVNRVRQRNLLISAFLLLLLAVNITVLTVAGFRAQRFARLQMDFVASVSHELRTPLAAIFSAAENIRDGVVRGQFGLRDYGSLIIGQSRQLMKHVDRVMLFASMRSGKDRYDVGPLEISEILRSVRDDTSALVLEESCVVEEQVEASLSRVSGDLYAVRSCLENLITNAVKYRREDPLIRISATREWDPSGRQNVAISVEDHGIGIKKTELEHIFEPFYRCPGVIARQIRGTGLGLCLAKHLAESMGGSLSVVSEFGVGSIFTLHLPVALEEEYEPSTVSSRRDEGERR
jgi:signal transduction histidine kinase